MVWVVYILRCSDNSLYTGMTNNIEKRFAAHHQGKAAKYTRSRRPVKFLVTSLKMERGDARRLEIKIQKLPKAKKIAASEHAAGRPSATGKNLRRVFRPPEKKLLCSAKKL